MAIWISCDSALTIDETRVELLRLRAQHADIFKYFWVTDAVPADGFAIEDGLKLGLSIKCGFNIRLNNGEGGVFMPIIPQKVYEVFGKNNVIVRNLDHEIIAAQ